jgi:predicted MPP superfamily phosphohydrolase
MMTKGLKSRALSRRTFFGLLGTGAGGVAYMHFGEPEWLEVNQPQVNLSGSGSGAEIRVLHLSDFHASPVVDLKFIEHAVELGVSLKPDVVCLTGDFITRKYDEFGEYARILAKLSAAAPTFACMGNHDGGSWVRRWGYADWTLVAEMLRNAGVTLLHNRAEQAKVNGRRIQFVGVGDLWSRELDATKAFRETEKEAPTILLSHNPDSKIAVADFSWKLMLSGHTHGGQCKIPLLGTPFAPVADKRYVAGLKPWRDRWIHVTKGVGNLHGLRFNCRPEVTLVRAVV